MKRNIAIATGTRADWGLLSPLSQELASRGNTINIIATNMHFLDQAGMTYKEIIDDGFNIHTSIPTSSIPEEIMSEIILKLTPTLKSLRPDCIIILGDRFEMLAVAASAILSGTPITHIAGGTISEGAIDDSFRHAITKMSNLHLTETDEHRKRVIQMGEVPESVVCTGAIGVHNALNITPLTKKELEESINFEITDQTLLVTLHAATRDTISPATQMQNLITALKTLPDYQFIFTYPNNDVETDKMISIIHKFKNDNPQRVCITPSLGRIRYLSALKYVSGVVGNSSSGLVEVPSMKIPTLDIGIRQKGRTSGNSVLHCGSTIQEIIDGLRTITSDNFRSIAASSINPYYKANTISLMADTIESFPFSDFKIKSFHDIPF